MASKNVQNVSVYKVSFKVQKGLFKEYVTNNLDGNIFIRDTPHVIESLHYLLAINDTDVRNQTPQRINELLKKCQSQFGKVVDLTIANSSATNFEEILNAEEVR